MVVAVLANIVEIIVFATCTNALSQRSQHQTIPRRVVEKPAAHLLCIDRTLQLAHRLSLANCPKEDGLELVHARIREEEGGVIVRDNRG
jgi:hypothetical protein